LQLMPDSKDRPLVSGLAARAVYVITAVLSGLGLLGKADLLNVAFHVHGTLLWMFLVPVVLAPAFWPIAIRFRGILTPLVLVGMVSVVTFVYPHVRQLHDIGRGSDQADCVIVAGDQMLRGQWPYQRALLWSHNPMSCGPGWAALQAPSIRLVGYQGTLLLIWFCSLIALVRNIGWERSSAITAMIFLSSGVWIALANGSDFLSFGICILALAITYESSETTPVTLTLLTAVIVQFRFPTVFLPLVLKKRQGRLAQIIASLIASGTFGVFLLLRPSQMILEGPLFLFRKILRFSSASVPTSAEWVTFVLLFLCGFMALVWVSRCFSGLWPTMVYMLILFGLPAIITLIENVVKTSSLVGALRDWEGGMWLLACLPLAAALCIRDGRSTRGFQNELMSRPS
jgi:hypothetical protein